MIVLHFLSGPYSGKVYPVHQNRITIGRSNECNIIINENSISRKHALLERNGNHLFLVDHNSKNGTLINGKLITPEKRISIKPGDSIKIGNSTMFVVNREEKEQPKSSDSSSFNKLGNFLQTQIIDPIKTTFIPNTKMDMAPTAEIKQLNQNNQSKGSHLHILDQIDEGGMSKIYKALFLDTGEIVAIKLPNAKFKSNKDVLDLFKKEIKMSLRFKHPNIIETLMEVMYDDMPTMVMEYFPSITMAHVIEKKKTLRNQKRILEQTFDAFAYVHNRGIIHNDIKPGNILINSKSIAKISDFGTAGTPVEIKKMRAEWRFFGTLPYISPEQLIEEPIDFRSDIYSMGIVLYEYLTGINPFRVPSNNPEEIRDKQIHFIPIPLTDYNPHIKESLSKAVLKSLEKDPANRYTDMKRFKAEIFQYL